MNRRLSISNDEAVEIVKKLLAGGELQFTHHPPDNQSCDICNACGNFVWRPLRIVHKDDCKAKALMDILGIEPNVVEPPG